MTTATDIKPNWKALAAAWSEHRRPLAGTEHALRLKAAHGADTGHALIIAEDCIASALTWMRRAYPNSHQYPPLHAKAAVAAHLARYGKAAYNRHEELADNDVAWSDYLLAQDDIPFNGKLPPFGTLFGAAGLARYNRWSTGGEHVDGRRVKMLTEAQRRALLGQDGAPRWQELVSQWEAGCTTLANLLLLCPGLSAEAAVVLENHKLAPAFLIADPAGIIALDSGALPRQKVELVEALLVELERNPKTAQAFYKTVQEKGATL